MSKLSIPTKKPSRRLMLIISAAILIPAAMFIMFVAPRFVALYQQPEEDWVVFGGGGQFIAANVGEKTPAGLWVATIAPDKTVPEYEPSIALSFLNLDCDERRYRITSRMKQFDSGVTRTASSKDAPWEAVPPTSVDSPERTVFEIFCDEGDPEYRDMPGTPLQFREIIRDTAEQDS
ncbi:hypothetical protein [Erythrobacter aureus]|uniref:Uncharacterized protein n=1 Tax=Erythrobacter aureus TaxID=2182384 RepID=A0A345YJ95_9SPHN|nr:hypothetical protein [Erythrobacter aureus]AXK43997.1 hypothetical protein DVR09_16210 [Erythrobacter aureus]